MKAAVALCIGAVAVAAPASGFAYVPAPTRGWAARGRAFAWEFSAGPAVALDIHRGVTFAGASLRGAWLRSTYSDFGAPAFRDLFVGDIYGLELRVQTLVGLGDASTLVVAGLAPVAMNAVGDTYRGTSWVRVPSIFGAVLPELGVAVLAGDPRFYLRWELPFSVLLGPRVALEARPSVALIDGLAPNGSAGVLVAISLGVLFR